jgi:hypothetical protein
MKAKFAFCIMVLALGACRTGSEAAVVSSDAAYWRNKIADGAPLAICLAEAIPFIVDDIIRTPEPPGSDLSMIRAPIPIDDTLSFQENIDQFAVYERLSAYLPGMGLLESVLREQNGDYAGAVLAFYKEYLFNYSHIGDAKDQTNILYGMKAISAVYGGEKGDAQKAALAVENFISLNFKACKDSLKALFADDSDVDSFAQWLILVCSLESGEKDRTVLSRYSAMQGRYKGFPLYWYYIAKHFDSSLNVMNAAEYGINLAPQGPCSADMRTVLARGLGLPEMVSGVVLTLKEIDGIILESIQNADTAFLDATIPLLALPDNPATSYLIGTFSPMAGHKLFNAYFTRKAEEHGGLIAERLAEVLGRSGK